MKLFFAIPTLFALLLVTAIGTVAMAAEPAAGVSALQQASFDAWKQTFIAKAAAEGHPEKQVRALFAHMSPEPAVLDRDGNQPEFVQPIWVYLDSAVSEARVRAGRDANVAYQGLLTGLQIKYGVPRDVILAVWGLESAYGKIQGNFDIVRSLATLAWDGRRREWAEGELMSVLVMLERGVPRDKLKGAWAGAMGQTQFLPSTYLQYAVDGNGDGQIDIWDSPADALASTANYLARHGWVRNAPWGEEVVLSKHFPLQLAEDTVLTFAQWKAKGADPVNPDKWQQFAATDDARLILPAGALGPALLVGRNFRVIKRYNNSTAYALGVGLLSHAIAGQPDLQQAWPTHILPLKRSQVKEVQELLHKLGYDPKGVDGMAGPNTRRALRAYQSREGLLPDGFISVDVLNNLRASYKARHFAP